MKFKGKPLSTKNYGTVSLKKGDEVITLKVAPLPMGYSAKLTALGVMAFPPVPKTMKFDEKRNAYVRHPITKEVETEENQNDPEYRKKVSLVMQRITVLKVREHLKEDENLEWGCAEPESEKEEDWIQYADELVKELVEAGFTDEELTEILETGDRISCTLNVDEAVERFLPESP